MMENELSSCKYDTLVEEGEFFSARKICGY